MADRKLLEASVAAVDEVLMKRSSVVGSGLIGDSRVTTPPSVLRKGGDMIQSPVGQVSSRVDREASSKAIDEALQELSKSFNSVDMQKALDERGLGMLRSKLPTEFATKSDDEVRRAIMYANTIRDAVSDTESDVRAQKEIAMRSTAAPRVESGVY